MGFIERMYTGIVSFLDGIGQSQFGAIAGDLAVTGQLFATVVVLLVVLNMGMQRVPISANESIMLIVKITFVALFMQNWTQFNSLVNALYSLFDSMSASFLSATIGTDTENFAEALDDMLAEQAQVATVAVGRLDIYGAVMNGIFYLLMVVFGAISAFVMIASRVILTLLIGIAPLAIMCTLSNATKSYFEKWFSALINMMMFPVIVAAVFGTCIAMMQISIVAATTDDPNTIGQTMPIGMSLMLSIILVISSPFILSMITGDLMIGQLASKLSGAPGAAVMGAAGQGKSAAAGAFSGGGSGVSGAIGRGAGTMARDTAGYAQGAVKAGTLRPGNIDATRAAQTKRMMGMVQRYQK